MEPHTAMIILKHTGRLERESVRDYISEVHGTTPHHPGNIPEREIPAFTAPRPYCLVHDPRPTCVALSHTHAVMVVHNVKPHQ